VSAIVLFAVAIFAEGMVKDLAMLCVAAALMVTPFVLNARGLRTPGAVVAGLRLRPTTGSADFWAFLTRSLCVVLFILFVISAAVLFSIAAGFATALLLHVGLIEPAKWLWMGLTDGSIEAPVRWGFLGGIAIGFAGATWLFSVSGVRKHGSTVAERMSGARYFRHR
jgi:hypothetical protein